MCVIVMIFFLEGVRECFCGRFVGGLGEEFLFSLSAERARVCERNIRQEGKREEVKVGRLLGTKET